MDRELILFKCIFDAHYNGPDPMDTKRIHGSNVIYGGDNFEFKNIPHKSKSAAILDFHKFLSDASENGTTVIRGNHEVRMGKALLPNYIDNEILFDHGDFLWSSKRRNKWHNRKVGQGKIFIALSGLLSKARHIVPKNKLSKKQIRKAVSRAKEYGCHTIVFGHTHPSKLIDIRVDGIRIINCTRGWTNIWA